MKSCGHNSRLHPLKIPKKECPPSNAYSTVDLSEANLFLEIHSPKITQKTVFLTSKEFNSLSINFISTIVFQQKKAENSSPSNINFAKSTILNFFSV